MVEVRLCDPCVHVSHHRHTFTSTVNTTICGGSRLHVLHGGGLFRRATCPMGSLKLMAGAARSMVVASLCVPAPPGVFLLGLEQTFHSLQALLYEAPDTVRG